MVCRSPNATELTCNDAVSVPKTRSLFPGTSYTSA